MITKLIEDALDTAWIRTCNECGHKQVDTEPKVQGVMTLAYENRKCKKCKSESLDYGTSNASNDDWYLGPNNGWMES